MKAALGLALAVTVLMLRPFRAAGQAQTVSLQPFTRVRICAPFGALITPSPRYELSLDAEQSVKNAVTTSISNAGTLTIGTSDTFSTQQPIKLIVRLPATALAGVEVNAPITTEVAVNRGFTPNGTFDATLTGSGDLQLLALNATTLTLRDTGAGNLVARGNFGNIRADSNGAGTITIGGGTIQTVTASAGGVGKILIAPANPNAAITGSTSGLGQVRYTQGTCQLIGSNIPGVTDNPAAAAVSQLLGTNPFGALGGGCTQDATIALPPANPQFTCGLRAFGTFDCTGTFGSASSSGGTGGSVTVEGGGASTSTSGGGQAFAGTSGGPGQVQFVQQTGPGQTSITAGGAVQTIPCNVTTPGALNMI